MSERPALRRTALILVPFAALLLAGPGLSAADRPPDKAPGVSPGKPVGEAGKPAFLLSAPLDPRSPTGFAIPGDLAAAVAGLERILPPGVRDGLLATPEEEHARLHPELGRWIKSSWGLYQNSELAQWFENLGVLSPDDMAGMVLLGLWRRLRGVPLDVEPLLDRYGVRQVSADSLPPVELGTGRKKETAYRFEGRGFTADLAPGTRVRVKESPARPGFTIAYFYGAAGEKQLLAVYAGPHPSFPAGVPERTRIRKGTFAGLPAEFVEWKRDGRACREIKVEMPDESTAWLHLWYRGLDASAKKEAERIISRLRPVRSGG
jgi:hypothetical protein